MLGGGGMTCSCVIRTSPFKAPSRLGCDVCVCGGGGTAGGKGERGSIPTGSGGRIGRLQWLWGKGGVCFQACSQDYTICKAQHAVHNYSPRPGLTLSMRSALISSAVWFCAFFWLGCWGPFFCFWFCCCCFLPLLPLPSGPAAAAAASGAAAAGASAPGALLQQSTLPRHSTHVGSLCLC